MIFCENRAVLQTFPNLQRLRELAATERLLLSSVCVSDQAAMQAWANQVNKHFGEVDGVINNAGVAPSCHASDQPREQMDWLFNINFWGVVSGVEAFLPELMRRPEACIVNISSLFGLLSVPSQSAYNVAKAAVRGYSESLRQDLRETRIKVVTVHPGGIQTNIANNGRQLYSITGNAADVDKTAALLNSIAATSPGQAAKKIMLGMRKSTSRVLIGSDAWFLDKIQCLFPACLCR